MNRFIPITLFLICFAQAENLGAAMFPFNLPWDDASPTFLDRSSMNATPAGAAGYVTVGAGAHLYAGGSRVRFWGLNLTSSACFPDHADSDKIAARMAKLGVNVVRFHLMDACWGARCIFDRGYTDTRHLDASNLEKLDYLFARLKEKGIYANLNLLTGRNFTSSDGLPAAIDAMDWKDKQTPAMFDPAMIALQMEYATQLLTHVNPYTGLAYKDDPAVAFIEVLNEHGLLHAWRNGQIDSLPATFSSGLQAQWNAYLKTVYADHAALAAAWATTTPPGAEMLRNPAFASGQASWTVQLAGTAAANVTTPAEGPSGSPSIKIEVTSTSTEDWHTQMYQAPQTLTAGTVYTARFSGRADRTTVVGFVVEMNHDPWYPLGVMKAVTLTTAWQSVTFTFLASASDNVARFNIRGMPDELATYWYADCSLAPGGTLGVFPGEDLDTGTILPIFLSQQGDRNAAAISDWMDFLWDKERDYWHTLRDHVKTTLGAHGLMMGTVVGNSTPNLMDDFDVVDSHAYWHHPSMPSGWGGPWWIGNSSMVGDLQGGTMGGLSVKRVAGKPFSVTEYGHPAPMSFDSECNLFLAAYGALQDWDALFAYTYNDGTLTWSENKQNGYFDFQRHPGKCMNLLVGANLFRRADVAPALQAASASLSASQEKALIPSSWAWRLVDANSAGMPFEAALLHRLYLATDDQTAPPGALAPGSVVVPASDRFVSDTGELDWNAAGKVLTVNTGRTKAVLGYSMGQTFDLGGFSIRPTASLQNWACLSLSVMQGTDLTDASKILLAAQGLITNSNINYTYYATGAWAGYPPPADTDLTLASWGTAPVSVEGIGASLKIPYPPERVEVWALDGTGAHVSPVAMSDEGGETAFSISDADQTLWYEISILEAGATRTPTSTHTPTPTGTLPTPTSTVTPTPSATPLPSQMIDDLEDNNSQINLTAGRNGNWFLYSDGSAPHSPSGGFAPSAPGAAGTSFAARMWGGPATLWGGGMGFDLRAPKAAYDLAALGAIGVRFLIKSDAGPVNVRVEFSDLGSDPLGGLCSTASDCGSQCCYDHWGVTLPVSTSWQAVTILFSEMTQRGFGLDRPSFTLDSVYAMQVGVGAGFTYDVWIDEIELLLAGTPVPSSTPMPAVTATPSHTFTVSPSATLTPSASATGSPSPTSTPTPSLTSTTTPSATFTATPSPTSASSPLLPDANFLLPFPNPNDGIEPLSFYYRLEKPADKVLLKLYTTAFRKLYEDAAVPAEAGVHLYTLRWDQTGLNLANGLYYLVLIRKEGTEEARETMKLIIRR